jgi:hypothetical protein
MESRLYRIDEVVEFINQGKLLALAADEQVLEKLPKGNWIAGTIPYFMDVDKGKFSQDLIYVNEINTHGGSFLIKEYDSNNIDNIISDSYENGYIFIIIPPFQQIHQDFAIKSESLEGLYNNPVVGWICGMDLNSMDTPKTYNGTKGETYADKAIVLHVQLPDNVFAQIDIVNIFERDENSPEIKFYIDNFDVLNCLIDGVDTNLANYIKDNNIDPKLPLMADYSGASINVSIKEVDTENGLVSFYAPVFESKIYKFAKPVNDYVSKFEVDTLDIETNSDFSCNCILNYLYGELENKKISNVKGPVTFGEIGYQLLNQTLVTLHVEEM